MALTERQIRNAQPREKEYKLFDGAGLLMRVKPNGTKIWQYKFRVPFGDRLKEKSLSLGLYDTVTLKEAREKCADARRHRDPAEERKKQKRLERFNSENTFCAVAEEWHKANLKKWSSAHARKLWRRLELHVLSELGPRAIAEITTLELLDALRKVEKEEKTETSHRALQSIRAVFQYAVLTQRIQYNPAIDLTGVLKAHKAMNYPSISHNEIPAFLEKLEVVETSRLNRLAIKFLMLTFVRQGEMRQAKWTDFNLQQGEWRIRAETTKMKTAHLVPLSRQALAVLVKIGEITGASPYVFASQQTRRNPFMSENTINSVIHDMGYKGILVGHGFRSMASTILNETGAFRPDVIERQLAHMPRDKVRAAYNRAEYLPERRSMMQWWGDYLEKAGLLCDAS